jgi:hypothetical protein
VEIYIDTKDIERFFWSMLVKLGYAPTDDECQDLADICFDYIMSLGFMDEVEYYE